MKFLVLFLVGLPALASEPFDEGAARIAHEFALNRDQDEALGYKQADQMVELIKQLLDGAGVDNEHLKAQLRKPLDDRPMHEYFGVASATFHFNAPWYELREDIEKFYRDYSKNARIAWFEPRQEPDGPGKMRVSFPYAVKTDIAPSLLPVNAKPLKELLILALVRVDMEGSKWQIATEVADHDLIHWNQMLGENKVNRIQGYKAGAIMIARFGDSAPEKGGWRLVEAYEFGKPSPSRPEFRILRAKPEEPLQTATILQFPGCAKNVTK